jgi:hypothetical protein
MSDSFRLRGSDRPDTTTPYVFAIHQRLVTRWSSQLSGIRLRNPTSLLKHRLEPVANVNLAKRGGIPPSLNNPHPELLKTVVLLVRDNERPTCAAIAASAYMAWEENVSALVDPGSPAPRERRQHEWTRQQQWQQACALTPYSQEQSSLAHVALLSSSLQRSSSL